MVCCLLLLVVFLYFITVTIDCNLPQNKTCASFFFLGGGGHQGFSTQQWGWHRYMLNQYLLIDYSQTTQMKSLHFYNSWVIVIHCLLACKADEGSGGITEVVSSHWKIHQCELQNMSKNTSRGRLGAYLGTTEMCLTTTWPNYIPRRLYTASNYMRINN